MTFNLLGYRDCDDAWVGYVEFFPTLVCLLIGLTIAVLDRSLHLIAALRSCSSGSSWVLCSVNGYSVPLGGEL